MSDFSVLQQKVDATDLMHSEQILHRSHHYSNDGASAHGVARVYNECREEPERSIYP